MRGLRLLPLLLAVAGLATASAASGAAAPWEAWTNPDEGFRITIPKSWLLVPNSVARVKTEITKLGELGEAPIAVVYQSLISTPKQRTALERYSFYAFAYSTLPVKTTVSVALSKTTKQLASPHGLAEIAGAESLHLEGQGWRVSDHRVVSLPAGRAAYIDGSYTTSGDPVDFAIYTIAHGTSLYQLSFSADAAGPDIAATSTMIATIAQHFAFT